MPSLATRFGQSVQSDEKRSFHLSLSLLWHPSQHIPHAVHYAALLRHLWPYITNSSQKAGVAIGGDELRGFESSIHQVMQDAFPGLSALPTSKAQLKRHSFALSVDAMGPPKRLPSPWCNSYPCFLRSLWASTTSMKASIFAL